MRSPTTGEILWYLTDHLGGTSLMVDANGEITSEIAYYPYGLTRYESNGEEVRYRYTGKELDATGLHYFGARYYDAKTATWLSTDPIFASYMPTGDKEHDQKLPGMGGVFNAVNLNVYHYAGWNPVMLVDPNGKEVKLIARQLNIWGIGGVGVHTFLLIRPDNPKDFNGEPMFVLGAYKGAGDKLISGKNDPVDLNWITTGKGIKGEDIVPTPEGKTDTQFIKDIMAAFGRYESGSREYQAFSQISQNEGNCNNVTTGALMGAGVDSNFFNSIDPPGANPGLGTALPEMLQTE